MSPETDAGTAVPGIKSDVSEIGPCKLSIKIEIPQAEVAAKLEDKYKTLGTAVAIPGFRKGKVPRKLLEKRFGKDLTAEAKGDLMRDSFESVVKEKGLVILGDPEVDADAVAFDPEKPLAFEVKVEVRPKITLGTYKGLEAKRAVAAVADADVDKGIQDIRERQTELVPQEGGKVEKNDVIICDEEFLIEGEEPVKHENVEIVADGEHLTVFEQPRQELAASLIGAQAGESREEDVVVPADFAQEKLRGKRGTVRLKIQEIKRPRLPEATDEWAKTLDFETLAHMREEVRKRLVQAREEEAMRDVEGQLVDQIVAAHDFPLPEGMVARTQQDFIQRKHSELEMAGVPHEEVHKMLEKVGPQAKEVVVRGLRGQLLLDEIGKKEKIFVTQPEVEARIEEVARRHKRWPHEIKEHYEQQGLMGQLRMQLREEKVRAFLVRHAKVTDAPAEPPKPA